MTKLIRKPSASRSGRQAGPSGVVRSLGNTLCRSLPVLAFWTIASAALAANGETGLTGAANDTPGAPEISIAVDADYTPVQVSTAAPIPSGHVRNLTQDRGVAVIIGGADVTIFDALSDFSANETDTSIIATAFGQLNCGVRFADGGKFCIVSASTSGIRTIRGNNVRITPGGYAHLLVEECADGCAATAGSDTAFDPSIDDSAVFAANALLQSVYPNLEDVEFTVSSEIAATGRPGSLEVALRSNFNAQQVFPGALATNVKIAPAEVDVWINTPKCVYIGRWCCF